ncbi:hypothetical protein [Nocardia tengchongensis]|uniref:hypothetical protein n=1 Tax=Nocardia tengchongensis TaxID=2055889 RepID=UPI0036B2F156
MSFEILSKLPQAGIWVMLWLSVQLLILVSAALVVMVLGLKKARPEDVPALVKAFFGGFGRWPNSMGGNTGQQHELGGMPQQGPADQGAPGQEQS